MSCLPKTNIHIITALYLVIGFVKKQKIKVRKSKGDGKKELVKSMIENGEYDNKE